MFVNNTEELAQNKLLLLYIIHKSENPLTNEEITEFVLENNYMNYFLIQQYLSELIDADFIEHLTEGEKNVYHLLSKGKSTLSYFEDRISSRIKEEISEKFAKVKETKKIETQIIGEFFQKNNSGYVVNLKLVENTENLFSLYLNVATIQQAKMICDTWKSNTEYIYKNILNMLADDEITLIED